MRRKTTLQHCTVVNYLTTEVMNYF